MFTGLIDDVGILDSVQETAAGRELRTSCRYTDLNDGESIALNGACLTVREHGPGWFTVAAIGTTLERTTIPHWQPGTRVNLERALQMGDRLGGHLVQGHVDGVGIVKRVTQMGDACVVDVQVPAELADITVLHGSITLDGVSLTVNQLPAPSVVQVSLIEYTLRHTTLGDWAPGVRVHIEADVIGKYVQRLLAPYVTSV